MSKPFLSGVIEGFYGPQWPHATRVAYARILSLAGLNTYLYCPKADSTLRREWRRHWPVEYRRQMDELSRVYQGRGLNWGVGLSPFELYRHYGSSERQQLRDKIDYLGELGAPLLAILFDDMPGDLDGLAERQAEIVADVCAWLPGVRVLACPTYYSFDPVLERVFGVRPERYWEVLGSGLPPEVEVFWTGNQVCSEHIAAEDLQGIVELLGRPVTLWDNYPVNDSEKRSNFLYTSPLAGRSATLRPLLHGHLCNPMNQGLLSLPALAGLSALYGGGRLTQAVLAAELGDDLWQSLTAHAEAFEIRGRSGLGEEQCAELAQRYARYPGPAAQELVGWLRGEYAFDPACLTD